MDQETKGSARASRGGRTLNTPGQVRFDTLMEAGFAILVRDGYAQLRMRKVADEAGISVGHLQHFLPTKESLFEALWEYFSALYDDAYQRILQDLPDRPLDRLQAIVRYLVEENIKPINKRLFIELWSMSLHFPGANAVMSRMHEHHRDVVAGMIEAALPGLSAADYHSRSLQISSLLDGLLVHANGSFEEEASRQAAESAIKTIMSIAIAPPTAGS